MALTNKFIEQAKQKLTKRKKELENEITRLSNQDPYQDKKPDYIDADPIDDVAEDLAHEDATLKSDVLEKELEQIIKALKRIEEGTYGLDENTGKPIDIKRLEANPSATTAI